MQADKVKTFMTLAGQRTSTLYREGSNKERELGAKLLLSEVLEYVIKGLGVIPSFKGTDITDPNGLDYKASEDVPNEIEMIDGLADVAYTMYWNALAFGVPLEEGFDLVCDNNLEKFVSLAEASETLLELSALDKEQWHLDKNISWPEDVVKVEIIRVEGIHYAVGKDASGKVKKPSSYSSVDLGVLASGS
jgi:predicted HAD superfamily Cof-like phosphohydrolase